MRLSFQIQIQKFKIKIVKNLTVPLEMKLGLTIIEII